MSVVFHVRDVVDWTAGRLLRGSAQTALRGASIDSRAVGVGELFVAIRGPRHDAHAFLAQAAERGAAALVVQQDCALPPSLLSKASSIAIVAVHDTTRALGAVGNGHRAGFKGPVVALTGSNGKTTTKEMCAAILSVTGPCLKTQGNLNNEFGVPLTLLRREPEHRILVIEIGMNHRGEIAPLAAIAKPTVGIITNIGTAHIENLGSQDEIAREKGDLVAALGADATAVLNAADPRVLAQRSRTRARVMTFGDAGDVRAEHVTPLGSRGFAFDLVAPQGRVAVHVAGLGESSVINALAAATGALAAGATLSDVASGLGRYRPIGGRMEPVELPRNIIVINDTYNANPQSMEVALRSLAELKGSSRGLAVLGDMGELGTTSLAAHRATGRLVAELGIEYLFALGQHANETAAGALAAGMEASRVRVARDHRDASERLREILQGDDWILVKGSRSMQMERVVDALVQAQREAS
ncbi:MAG TPA: UDP-N-acetylmuramoyl-tripeptide--D-alanyl-D-alanine ligase [Myxococcota bacterium]|nr:UDP-N-acetylmuramoyl-tripeptide--D-alanyl-D-alanine ligase [Myxococcota bacterium]